MRDLATMQAAAARARQARKEKREALGTLASSAVTREAAATKLVEAFIAQHVSYPGPGFYLKDAHEIYGKWVEGRGTKLGRFRLCWKLESLGLTRSTRKGMTFFTNAKLKGGREVYVLFKEQT